MIVGWSIADHARRTRRRRVADGVFALSATTGTICHNDRGANIRRGSSVTGCVKPACHTWAQTGGISTNCIECYFAIQS
jgi:hypothetical protein